AAGRDRKSGRAAAAFGARFFDEVEPARSDRAAEGFALGKVPLDLGEDARLFGLSVRAEMALQRGPAIARTVAGVPLRHLQREVEAVGGRDEGEGLVGAGLVLHEEDGAVG